MLCDSTSCTGCEVCAAVCPQNAIEMQSDTLGFLHPKIEIGKCISCKLCEKHCHILNKSVNENDNNDIQIYAVWHKNQKVRMNSTSGGAFSALADSIIESGGCVIGAAYDKDFRVWHKTANTLNELTYLRGSKYIQSRLTNVFPEIKKQIGRQKVLFSGTPCQVAALINYIGSDLPNLYTVDIVCHGVGSPVVFNKYLDYIEKKNSAAVKQFRFRSKENSWRTPSVAAEFDDGKKYFKSGLIDPMFVGFNKDVFLRESCYHCRYTSTNRVSDLTISDFWGYQSKSADDIDDDYGISMLMVNTAKGNSLFDCAKSTLIVHNRDLPEALNGQPCLLRPTEKSPKREMFLKDINLGFEELSQKYFTPRYDFNCYYYYRANHTREESQKAYRRYRIIDAVSRRLKIRRQVIDYIERKNKK